MKQVQIVIYSSQTPARKHWHMRAWLEQIAFRLNVNPIESNQIEPNRNSTSSIQVDSSQLLHHHVVWIASQFEGFITITLGTRNVHIQ